MGADLDRTSACARTMLGIFEPECRVPGLRQSAAALLRQIAWAGLSGRVTAEALPRCFGGVRRAGSEHLTVQEPAYPLGPRFAGPRQGLARDSAPSIPQGGPRSATALLLFPAGAVVSHPCLALGRQAFPPGPSGASNPLRSRRRPTRGTTVQRIPFSLSRRSPNPHQLAWTLLVRLIQQITQPGTRALPQDAHRCLQDVDVVHFLIRQFHRDLLFVCLGDVERAGTVPND